MNVDTLVVGAGPMGASAVRHLAGDPAAGNVLVIGPEEHPPSGDGPFGAWHDEARITRVVADDDVWATLAEESIDRYPQIAAESGREFHQRQGVLYVHETGESFSRQWQVAERHRATVREADPAEYGYLRTAPGARVIDERGAAGTVNPRALVAAQLDAAARHGARVVRDHVVAIDGRAGGVVARTAGGVEVRARRVVVAAGAYAQAFGLLPEPLPVTAAGITAVFFRVDAEAGTELSAMPAVLWHHADPGEWLYMLPPIRYPDDHLWFKIGGHHHVGPLDTAAAIDAWHRANGSPEEAAFVAEWVAAHIPVLAGQESHRVGCVITETATGFPIIREVTPGVVVATGCNGASAKSCDEIGRLAAMLAAHAHWDSALDRSLFHG